jgi:hypothetical protein
MAANDGSVVSVAPEAVVSKLAINRAGASGSELCPFSVAAIRQRQKDHTSAPQERHDCRHMEMRFKLATFFGDSTP